MIHVNSTAAEQEEVEGEYPPITSFPIFIDIDDKIKRDIEITQEIFGIVRQYGNAFQVMRFTLHNKTKDGIKVQVMSLGAALVGLSAPDRKGVYKDIVLGFDSLNPYYTSLNPGFGRITSLCPLPYNLEKVVWDWDFDRDEGSVTFSTTFYKIDLILTVTYTLNTENELYIDLKACGSKIVPISLTNQVYWNLAGHNKGEEALKHHVLSVNSDHIWKHLNHKLKSFYPIQNTALDFRQPTLMDNPEVFGEKKFEHVFVLIKGCEEKLSFAARLIHPRSCRYVEIFTDQPWVLCNTLNKLPKTNWDVEVNTALYGEDPGESHGNTTPCASEDDFGKGEKSKQIDEIPGKQGAFYKRFGSFCITPLSDLTGFDPILRANKHYSHKMMYKIGIYRRYKCRTQKVSEDQKDEIEEEGEAMDDIIDIKNE